MQDTKALVREVHSASASLWTNPWHAPGLVSFLDRAALVIGCLLLLGSGQASDEHDDKTKLYPAQF